MAADSQGESWGCLSIIGLVGLATWLSNPGLATHRQALRVELQQRLDREVVQQDFLSGTLLWLTKDTMVATVVNAASYQNYGLASATMYEDQQLTFGVWGQVFVVAEDRSTAPALGTKHP